MRNRSHVIWSIKELVETLKDRQLNEFDANFVVTGRRGEGKSTLLFKIFSRFKEFKPWEHIVYSREDLLNLLRNQKFGLCWDDEAINSGYKRSFQDKGQQELIRAVTMYRDNFNLYGSAIPFFYSLDKDLRELVFMHIHVIQRGLAIIFIQTEDSIHQKDPWDTKNNEALENKWQKKLQQNPNFKIPYQKLSTFIGYLSFGKMTKKQEKLYKEIKRTKRAKLYSEPSEEKKESTAKQFFPKVYDMLINNKLDQASLHNLCEISNKKLSSVKNTLSTMLKDNGEFNKSIKFYLDRGKKLKENPVKEDPELDDYID